MDYGVVLSSNLCTRSSEEERLVSTQVVGGSTPSGCAKELQWTV